MANKKSKLKIVLVTAAALLLLPTVVIYTKAAIENQPQVEQKAESSVVRPKVTVIPVTAQSHQATITAFGEVMATDELLLTSEVRGRVVWRNPKFEKGNQLKKGEVLIKLDKTEYQAAVAQAQHELANADLALQQEQRQSQQAVKDWQRSGLKQQPSDLLLRKPQLKAAEARYQSALAALKQAKRNLGLTELTVAFDAVVISRQVAMASYVNIGDQLATLRSVEQAEITVALSQQQWQLLPDEVEGSSAELVTAGANWTGYIQRLADQVDTRTRLRELAIRVDQPLQQTQPLLTGEFVDAVIKGKTIDNIFAVPASALTADGYLWFSDNNVLKRQKAQSLFSYNGTLFIEQQQLPQQINLVHKPMASYLPGMQVSAVFAEGNE